MILDGTVPPKPKPVIIDKHMYIQQLNESANSTTNQDSEGEELRLHLQEIEEESWNNIVYNGFTQDQDQPRKTNVGHSEDEDITNQSNQSDQSDSIASSPLPQLEIHPEVAGRFGEVIRERFSYKEKPPKEMILKPYPPTPVIKEPTPFTRELSQTHNPYDHAPTQSHF